MPKSLFSFASALRGPAFAGGQGNRDAASGRGTAPPGPMEILDLRHFSSQGLRPLLDAEIEIWKQRLHWDYNVSAKLLAQYLDSHMLPGYAALQGDAVIGYVFCVYEETKAVIGDVFALPCVTQGANGGHGAWQSSCNEVELTLLKHLFETLLNSPQLDRIESQLLLHPSGAHADIFERAGFSIYRRLFLVQQLRGRYGQPRVDLPAQLELRQWREDDLLPAARLICEAYRGHPDSLINDQYRTVPGSQRFLHNIVRYSGCGTFSSQASHVIVHRQSRELVALLLGSRVSQESGHITQLCVHPGFRRNGIARMLLSLASFHFIRMGASEISLTVTEANAEAIGLYVADGYDCAYTFDAAVWQRDRTA